MQTYAPHHTIGSSISLSAHTDVAENITSSLRYFSESAMIDCVKKSLGELVHVEEVDSLIILA